MTCTDKTSCASWVPCMMQIDVVIKGYTRVSSTGRPTLMGSPKEVMSHVHECL